MDNCVFCKIVAGQIPNYTLFENEKFISFLDINPISPGNSLVIPKKHYRWVYNVPEFGEYWEVAKKITLATIKALNAESVSYLTLGYEVPHAHIRIIPRFPNDIHKEDIKTDFSLKITPAEMEDIRQKIIKFIK